MRASGKMSSWKFLLYLLIGAILGSIILGTTAYLVTIPREGDINLSVTLAAIYGAIFGGPLLASNLEKEK